MSRQGAAQFVDVGSGLPTSPNPHKVACRVNPAARVAGFTRALAPGSFLVTSVGVNSDAGLADQVTAEYSAGGLHVHDRNQVAGYFTGLELAGPGLTEVQNWVRAHHQDAMPYQGAVPSRPADVLAGIGRKTA